MPRFVKNTLTLALLGAMASNTAAQSSSKVDEVETLIVWGTQVKASSLSMDAETMEIKQPDHISDLLRIIPGVDVGGAHSLNQRITIRSMDDKDLRISIDGANQNTYMYHHMGNLQIHADILESAEIDVGNNSVINGGLGGAVRFKTKDAKHLLEDGSQFGGRMQAGYADNSGNSATITGYGQLTDSVDALVYFNKVNRDNYEVGGGEILNAQGNTIAGTDGTVRGLEGEVEDILVKFGWDLNDNHRLKLGHESYTDEGDYSYRPDMGLATTISISNGLNTPLVYPTEFSRDTTTLNYEGQYGDSTKVDASIHQNESTFWRDERGLASSTNSRIRAMAGIKEGNADNTGFNLLANTKLGSNDAHSLTYGFDYVEYETDYIVNSSSLSGEKADNSAFFIEDRIDSGIGLTFIPGIRYESSDVDSAVVSDTFSDTTGALAIEYEATDNWLIRASATELFRAPELAEIFTNAGTTDLPNPEIQEETGINQQLSAAYQNETLGADNFSIGVTFFQTEVDNYIYDNIGAMQNFKDNIGDMEIKGFEAYVGYDINQLKILLSYSKSESDLEAFDEYAIYDGARIDREQGDTISLSLDYELSSSLSLHWDTLWVDDLSAGKHLDVSSRSHKKDGFSVSNVAAYWEPIEKLGITVGVDNVFDEFYASQSSRTGTSLHPVFGELYLMDYEPGRNAKLTVSYRF